MRFEEIRGISGIEKLNSGQGNPEIGQLWYDSRLVPEDGTGTFFALVTERGNGHAFIPDLIEKGVKQWVVSESDWYKRLAELNHSVALASGTRKILSGIAAAHRSQFHFPVMAITGSNGKTIVKEWLSQLLGHRYSVCKNPKSFNSQIGVPLSVWNLSNSHNFGLFEAGISKSGEMQVLEAIIRPDLGILTNLGSAHQEGFESEEIKYREKLSLFQGSEFLILSSAVHSIHRRLIESVLPAISLIPWEWKLVEGNQYLLCFAGRQELFRLPFRDPASLENLGNAITAALHLGISTEEVAQALPALNLPEMRLSMKAGRYGNSLIDDSYTNDISGLEAALQFAGLQRRENQSLVLILSDAEGLSQDIKTIQESIRSLIISHNVSQLITVGRQFAGYQVDLSGGHLHFSSAEELMRNVSVSDFDSCIILIKGSRRFGLERLVTAWQEKIHGTYLEINLDALVHNLNFYKSRLPSGTGIMAMVKAFAYGSGDEEIARLLEFHRVDYLAVAYADEGIKLREAGIRLPIMVMNPTPDAMDSIFQYNLEPEIYSFRILNFFLDVHKSRRFPSSPAVHIKADTGMHRLGFFKDEAGRLAQKLLEAGIRVATVFSHLAAADDPALDDYTREQIGGFSDFCTALNSAGISAYKKHILNSAGIMRFPEASFDLVRLGIGLYGIESDKQLQASLKSVSRLKTIVSQVKTIRAGESVGYGRREFLRQDSRIATIAIGYSDGFRRAFSAGAVQLRWNDFKLPVVGNVCMDMSMINVTGTSIDEGDEITIFETASDVMELAKAAATIPYEILTGIGHRVKRIYYRE
jgi:alanine racemase